MGPASIVDGDATRALFASLAIEPKELCAFAYLAADRRLLGLRYTPSSSFAQVEVPIRAVATDALVLAASTIVMAHNHPSGDARPSATDLAVTRRLARAFDALGITLAEHLIFAANGITSLRELGIL